MIRRRRAFTLIEFIGLLPILLVILGMSYTLMARVERMAARESACRQDDARLRDVVRRIQADAARAGEASAGESPEGSRLTLRGPGLDVTYASDASGVARSERSADQPETRFTWPMRRLKLSFRTENIGPRPRIIWIVAAMEVPMDVGPERVYTLATAAALGEGGGP
ncbi:MAG: hypothetical protein HRF43_16580 [Phycisphaerae bacterium]|jgi:type II secretory pathway component PulJ